MRSRNNIDEELRLFEKAFIIELVPVDRFFILEGCGSDHWLSLFFRTTRAVRMMKHFFDDLFSTWGEDRELRGEPALRARPRELPSPSALMSKVKQKLGKSRGEKIVACDFSHDLGMIYILL